VALAAGGRPAAPPSLTLEHKQQILAGNIARPHGFRVNAPRGVHQDYEFRGAADEEPPPPYRTAALAEAVKTAFRRGATVPA
jgi:hypothetical protein